MKQVQVLGPREIHQIVVITMKGWKPVWDGEFWAKGELSREPNESEKHDLQTPDWQEYTQENLKRWTLDQAYEYECELEQNA